MKKMQFLVEINASKEKVWDTLWQDKSFRQWAGIIDPGTYMVGDLQEGSEVQFISAENGYGVTSLVEKLVPNEFLLLKHCADTQKTGAKEREKEWTGGAESYLLSEKEGATVLTITMDVPSELEAYFNDNYPKALERLKLLAEDGPFYHGTRADLRVGDLLTPGFKSNYRPEITMNHIYFTALVNGAGLAAELSSGAGRERVYIVEPTGEFEDDPNVTDKKFPGNPTRSYRSREPLKVVGEVTDWVRLTPEELQNWRTRLANIKGEIIN